MRPHPVISSLLLATLLLTFGCADETSDADREAAVDSVGAPALSIDEEFPIEQDTLRFAAGSVIYSESPWDVTLTPYPPGTGSTIVLSSAGIDHWVESVDSADNLLGLASRYARGSTDKENLQLIRVTDSGLVPLAYLPVRSKTLSDGPRPTEMSSSLDRRTRRYMDTVRNYDNDGNLSSTHVRDITFQVDSATGVWYSRKIWLDSIRIECMKGTRSRPSTSSGDSAICIEVNRFVPVTLGRFHLNGHWMNLLTTTRAAGTPYRAQMSSLEPVFCDEIVK